MDRRTTIALVLCMLVFAVFTALQTRFAPKRPPIPPPGAVRTSPADSGARAPGGGTSAPAAAGGAPSPPAPVVPALPPRTVVLETPLYRATFSNVGARMESFELKRYAAAWG